MYFSGARMSQEGGAVIRWCLRPAGKYSDAQYKCDALHVFKKNEKIKKRLSSAFYSNFLYILLLRDKFLPTITIKRCCCCCCCFSTEIKSVLQIQYLNNVTQTLVVNMLVSRWFVFLIFLNSGLFSPLSFLC